jgi:hypothetical protein
MSKRPSQNEGGPDDVKNVRFKLPNLAPAPDVHDSPVPDTEDAQDDGLANEHQSSAPLPDFILNALA